MNAVYQTSNGQLVSVGSVVANPLPAGLAAVALSAADGQALRDGTGRWEPSTLTVTILPPDPAIGNELTLRQRAAAALDTNATFLALLAPTNAQVVAQVRALTRQNNGLIRLTINQLDTIGDS